MDRSVPFMTTLSFETPEDIAILQRILDEGISIWDMSMYARDTPSVTPQNTRNRTSGNIRRVTVRKSARLEQRAMKRKAETNIKDDNVTKVSRTERRRSPRALH